MKPISLVALVVALSGCQAVEEISGAIPAHAIPTPLLGAAHSLPYWDITGTCSGNVPGSTCINNEQQGREAAANMDAMMRGIFGTR